MAHRKIRTLTADLLLVALTASGCTAGSGGVPTQQIGVNGGGQEPEPSSQPPASSHHETSTGNPSTTSAPTTGGDHPTGEPAERGDSPCTFAPASLGVVGKSVKGAGHVICKEEPNMLGGTLVLAFSHHEGAPWEFVEDSRISVTSLDIGKELSVATVCNEGLWLMYWEATGTDSKGRGFTDVYNYPAPPYRVDSCP